MLSAIPAVFSSEHVSGDPFPDFGNGFTPWDCSDHSDLFSAIQSYIPTNSSSGSEEPNPKQTHSNSGSKETNPKQTNSSSGSDEPKPLTPVIDARKLRRKISNRLSARRSRMRRQKHLENLRNQVNRLRMENRELSTRLRFVLYHCHLVRTDNDRLRSERTFLRQKLSEIREILVFQQLQQSTYCMAMQ